MIQQSILHSKKGTMYQIICRANEYALTIEDKQNYKNSRIHGEFRNIEDIAQLWFIQHIKNSDFEIVNALSSFCFDEEKGEIRLKKGEQQDDQLFSLEEVHGDGYYKWYWIKTQPKGNIVVTLQGTLKYKKIEQNNFNQMFRFQQFYLNQQINKTAIITNMLCGKVIDLPKASRKQGQKIIQYSMNKRFNQRWIFERFQNGVIIKNYHSQLVLDVEGQKKKTGTNVIQWHQTNKTNQLWKFQSKGNNTFIIQSMLEPSLYLGVQQNSHKDNKKLVIDKNMIIWHIEGKLPPFIDQQ